MLRPRWSSGKRSNFLMQKTRFKPRVVQINTNCHRLAKDASCTVCLGASGVDELRQLDTPNRY